MLCRLELMKRQCFIRVSFQEGSAGMFGVGVMGKIMTKRTLDKLDDMPGHLRCQPADKDGPHEKIRGPRVESYAVTWWECSGKGQEPEQEEGKEVKAPEEE